MKIVIEIPEKEFGTEIGDKFQDFFKRLSVEIKERLITNDTLLCGNLELETADMLKEAFSNGVVLPLNHGRLDDAIKAIEQKAEELDHEGF